jgi:hypothetical protein
LAQDWQSWKNENGKHPTPNIEHPIFRDAQTANHWMFGVGCSMFDVFLETHGQAVLAPIKPPVDRRHP